MHSCLIWSFFMHSCLICSLRSSSPIWYMEKYKLLLLVVLLYTRSKALAPFGWSGRSQGESTTPDRPAKTTTWWCVPRIWPGTPSWTSSPSSFPVPNMRYTSFLSAKVKIQDQCRPPTNLISSSFFSASHIPIHKFIVVYKFIQVLV